MSTWKNISVHGMAESAPEYHGRKGLFQTTATSSSSPLWKKQLVRNFSSKVQASDRKYGEALNILHMNEVNEYVAWCIIWCREFSSNWVFLSVFFGESHSLRWATCYVPSKLFCLGCSDIHRTPRGPDIANWCYIQCSRSTRKWSVALQVL